MRKLSQKILLSKSIIGLAKGYFVLVLFFLGVLSACGAYDFTQNNMEKGTMGPFGEKKDYIISPPFEGVLLENGKPLTNTIIVRSTSYNAIGDKSEDETFQTDDNGYFNIPEKIVKMRLSFLSQFVSHTELYVGNKNSENLIWYSNTTNSENIDKFDQYITQQPLGFYCDLKDDFIQRNGLLRSFKTKCRWENMPANDPDSIWNNI